MNTFELMLSQYYSKFKLEAGTDEAGRGCLSGPVVAAAVILPLNFEHHLLNDSKQLTEKNRAVLRPIIEAEAIAYAVAFVDEKEIDSINILNASIKAMHKALGKLQVQPEFIIVDGNRFKPYKDTAYKTIVKGDAKFKSIAAASILAKTYRDDFMMKMHTKYPQYCWNTNKGYPTKQHRAAIKIYGITPLHRKTFRLLPEQFELKFG